VECGVKRSATPLWMDAPPQIRRQSGVALRLPPHSIFLSRTLSIASDAETPVADSAKKGHDRDE